MQALQTFLHVRHFMRRGNEAPDKNLQYPV